MNVYFSTAYHIIISGFSKLDTDFSHGISHHFRVLHSGYRFFPWHITSFQGSPQWIQIFPTAYHIISGFSTVDTDSLTAHHIIISGFSTLDRDFTTAYHIIISRFSTVDTDFLTAYHIIISGFSRVDTDFPTANHIIASFSKVDKDVSLSISHYHFRVLHSGYRFSYSISHYYFWVLQRGHRFFHVANHIPIAAFFRMDTDFSLSFQGSPQWIQVDLEELYVIDEINIQFQGGFAGRDCWVEGIDSPEMGYKRLMEFYPEDSNSLQVSFVLWERKLVLTFFDILLCSLP